MTLFAYIFIFITVVFLINQLYEWFGISWQLIIDEGAKVVVWFLVAAILTFFLGIAFGLPHFEIKLIPHF